jgi:hypothetical protein
LETAATKELNGLQPFITSTPRIVLTGGSTPLTPRVHQRQRRYLSSSTTHGSLTAEPKSSSVAKIFHFYWRSEFFLRHRHSPVPPQIQRLDAAHCAPRCTLLTKVERRHFKSSYSCQLGKLCVSDLLYRVQLIGHGKVARNSPTGLQRYRRISFPAVSLISGSG